MSGGGSPIEGEPPPEPSGDDSPAVLRADGGVPRESLFEATPDPVVGYVREGGTVRATGANDAFYRVFDPEEPVAGRDLATVLVTGGEPAGTDDATAAEDSFVGRLEDGDPRTAVEHPTDAGRAFSLRAVPIEGENPPAGYAVYTEVTGRRERIRELEAAVDRLDELVSVAVHDLRNPLEVAAIRLEAARETAEAEHFEKVSAAHDRIEELIDGLRGTARDIEEVGETERVDLDEAVPAAWDGVPTGKATLETVGDLGTLRADPGGLRRLLENLFRNAVEHGSTSPRSPSEDAVEHGSTSRRAPADDAVDRGDPSVHVRVGALGDGEGFYVADDGPGIPPENHDEVFEAGFSTRSGGDGLGLAIVAGIADAHGWSVAVTESNAGGARFEVLIEGASV